MTDRQMFKLVNANTVPSEGGSCGCGGEDKKERAEQAAAAQQTPAAEHTSCGCGGHGHAAQA